MRTVMGRLGLLLLAATLAACGPATSGHTPSKADTGSGSVTLIVHSIPSLGKVLATDKGFTLYMFPPDQQRSSTCTGSCAGHWPPLYVPSGARLVAGAGVEQTLVGTVKSGGRQIATYNSWPLYTYEPDVRPGLATGQHLELDGGLWYVLSPSGTPIKTPVSAR